MIFNNLDNRLPSRITLSEDRLRRLEEIHQRLIADRRRNRSRTAERPVDPVREP